MGGRDPCIDYITIPGATVRELEHALMAEYSNVYRAVDMLHVGGLNDVLRGAVDMLHVGGLNDVLRGATDSEIMEDIWVFRTL